MSIFSEHAMNKNKLSFYSLAHLPQLLVEKGAIMEEYQGWERPAWFSQTNKVKILSYDYGGYYGVAKNQNDDYRELVEKERGFHFSPYDEMVSQRNENIFKNRERQVRKQEKLSIMK